MVHLWCGHAACTHTTHTHTHRLPHVTSLQTSEQLRAAPSQQTLAVTRAACHVPTTLCGCVPAFCCGVPAAQTPRGRNRALRGTCPRLCCPLSVSAAEPLRFRNSSSFAAPTRPPAHARGKGRSRATGASAYGIQLLHWCVRCSCAGLAGRGSVGAPACQPQLAVPAGGGGPAAPFVCGRTRRLLPLLPPPRTDLRRDHDEIKDL